MKNKFYCQNCKAEFEADGKQIDYKHPIYGPCWKRVAGCPICNTQSDEYKQKKSLKNHTDFDNFVSDLRNRGGRGCNPGGGCCG